MKKVVKKSAARPAMKSKPAAKPMMRKGDLTKYQKKGEKKGYVDARGISRSDAPIDDMSFVNALRRVALDPKSLGNWIESMGPQVMLKPFTQTAEAFESLAGQLGDERAKSAAKGRRETEAEQRRNLQQELKDKYGWSFKKGGSVSAKMKSKSKKK